MAENTLEVKIIGDASALEKELKKSEKLQAEYANSIKRTQNDIAENIKISRGYEQAIDQLNKELKEGVITQQDYSKQLTRLRRDEKETGIETTRLRKELASLKRDQKDLSTGIGGVGKSMGGLQKTTANATPTVIEFSRVIQDAPYGIQGVANNIQQLSGNFANLQKSAGGTLPALKALAGGFLGPAGIVFAISTITSLLVTYGDTLFDTTSDTEKLKEETDKNKEALDKYIESLRGIAKAQIEGAKGAAQEAIELRLLRRQIEDTSLSTEQREDAIKKLRDQFPGYFQDVTNEQLLNGQVASSYDVLSNSIAKRARATAALDILVDNAKAEIDANARLSQIEQDLIKNEQESIKLKQQSAKLDAAVGTNRGATTGAELSLQGKIYDLAQQENALIEERARLMQDVGRAQLDNYDLQKLINQNIVVEPEDTTKAVQKSAKEREKIYEDSLKNYEKALKAFASDENNFLTEQAKEDGYEAAQIYEQSGARIKAALKEIEQDPLQLGVEESYQQILKLEAVLKKLKGQVSEADFEIISTYNLEQLTAFQDKLRATQITADAFTSGISAGFSTLASNISNSLSTGSALLDSFVSAFVSSLAQVAAAMVQQAVLDKFFSAQKLATNVTQSNANAITVATSAAAALGPAGAIALPGLIASQLAIVNGAFAAIPKFAHGGIVPGGSFTGDKIPAFLNSGEVVMNGRQQANTLMAVANGNIASSANDNGVIELSTVIRGSDILLATKRAERNNNRFSS